MNTSIVMLWVLLILANIQMYLVPDNTSLLNYFGWIGWLIQVIIIVVEGWRK